MVFNFCCYRLFRRLQVPAAILAVLLQRTPLVRLASSAEFVLSPSANSILRGFIATAVSLAAVDTVTGATTISPAPGSNENPASAKVGEPFTGIFTVVGAPKPPESYKIDGAIPPGITIAGMVNNIVNSDIIVLSGTPTLAGNFRIEARAWNEPNLQGDGGTTVFIYTISVAPSETSGFPPEITSPPQSAAATTGSEVTLSVTANAEPTPSFQWQKENTPIIGATASTLTLTNITSQDAGNYRVVVTNSLGSTTSSIASLFVTAGTPLNVTSHPQSTNIATGASTTLTTNANGNGPVSAQWYRHRQGESDPTPLLGETNLSLNIPSVQATDMGFYFARLTDATNTVDSDAAILTTASGTSRLINLSTRGQIATGGTLTPGFVLRGDGNKPLIVRSVGPRLLDFGLTTALLDPTMDLIPLNAPDPLLSNDNWSDSANSADLADTSATLGAFSLAADSLDAAVLSAVPLPNAAGNRGYTVRISSTDDTSSGIAIAEVYDPEPANQGANLINVSALGFSGLGAEALIPGFVIGGDGAKTMLIRVVGPTLAEFGVTGAMTDPLLEIVPLNQSFTIASNDDWAGTETLQNAFSTSGAFDFPDSNSRDAAVVVRLPPGGYTVRVTGANDTTGIVLVEAYDLD